jgi:hypothetical protein
MVFGGQGTTLAAADVPALADANRALDDLRNGRYNGAAVLVNPR